MDNSAQIERMRKALELEERLSATLRQLEQLKAESFRSAPSEPVLKKYTSKYPVVDTKYPIWKKLAVLLIPPFPIVGILVNYFYFPKKEKEREDEIKSSAEYIKQCEDADNAAAEMQQKAYAEYQEQLKRFNEELLPQYKREKEEWDRAHAAALNNLSTEIETCSKELADHYEETRIVPSQYRTIDALTYMCETMESIPEYSVKEAIAKYDAEIERRHRVAALQEQRRQNQLLDQKNAIEAERNELIDEQNAIAEKTRRDDNIRGAIGVLQQHNRNKYIKDYTKRH